MKLTVRLLLINGAILCNLFVLGHSQAQIVPDATLPRNSQVQSQESTSIIMGGTKAGRNLFHSFRQFSIPPGSTAYFNNDLDVQNIISRVTGSSISNINGLIRANGTANLFLLNPNGIIFGSNASLNIGGSFLATTASDINFTDGTQFSVNTSQFTSLLTVAVPIALRFSSSPGEIRVLGNGNNVTALDYQPLIRGTNFSNGLRVGPEQTLAIVGGDVNVEGGILAADGGRVELGSVNDGFVSLNSSSHGWSLGYERVRGFRDIRLTQRALVDASGIDSGSIQVQSRRLQLSDSSLILIQNQGSLPTGDIKVNTSEALTIKDVETTGGVASGIWSETLGFASGGNIEVSTPNLTLQTSGQIFTGAYGAAKAGNITLSVPKSLQVIGPFPNELGRGTLIGSISLGEGESGNITISTGQLSILNGGVILTANATPITSGLVAGRSGDVNINATDFVEVNGTESNFFVPSTISAATDSTGRAGNVTITTPTFRVRNGGLVDSSTTAIGTAGNVTINASDSVEVSGVASNSGVPSLVRAAATTLNSNLQNAFQLFVDPRAISGKVLINTKQFFVRDGAQISVSNEGIQTAGDLQVNADAITLDNSSSITAGTLSGNGGSIFLRSNNLQLRRGSTITTTAGASGNGGNITIGTGTLVALENSKIAANAIRGRGGNIRINSQGIFRSLNSTITASSNLGINGTVQVNTLVNPSSFGVVKLPVALVDTTKLIGQGCPLGTRPNTSKFVIVGRGGIPLAPGNTLSIDAVWADLGQNSSHTSTQSDIDAAIPSTEYSSGPLVEAAGWATNSKGEVVLVAHAPTLSPNIPWLSPTTCNAPQF